MSSSAKSTQNTLHLLNNRLDNDFEIHLRFALTHIYAKIYTLRIDGCYLREGRFR